MKRSGEDEKDFDDLPPPPLLVKDTSYRQAVEDALQNSERLKDILSPKTEEKKTKAKTSQSRLCSGHLFVAFGDVHRLTCDAWALPSKSCTEIDDGWRIDRSTLPKRAIEGWTAGRRRVVSLSNHSEQSILLLCVVMLMHIQLPEIVGREGKEKGVPSAVNGDAENEKERRGLQEANRKYGGGEFKAIGKSEKGGEEEEGKHRDETQGIEDEEIGSSSHGEEERKEAKEENEKEDSPSDAGACSTNNSNDVSRATGDQKGSAEEDGRGCDNDSSDIIELPRTPQTPYLMNVSKGRGLRFDLVLVAPTEKLYSIVQAMRRRLDSESTNHGHFWNKNKRQTISEYNIHISWCIPDKRCAREKGIDARSVGFIDAGAKAWKNKIPGISFGAGLPSWGGLIKQVADAAGFSEEEFKALKSYDFLEQARLLRQRLGDRMGEMVASQLVSQTHSLQHSLVAQIPASGYEDKRSALLSVVRTLLMTKHMVFIGFSLTDYNFHKIAHAEGRGKGRRSKSRRRRGEDDTATATASSSSSSSSLKAKTRIDRWGPEENKDLQASTSLRPRRGDDGNDTKSLAEDGNGTASMAGVKEGGGGVEGAHLPLRLTQEDVFGYARRKEWLSFYLGVDQLPTVLTYREKETRYTLLHVIAHHGDEQAAKFVIKNLVAQRKEKFLGFRDRQGDTPRDIALRSFNAFAPGFFLTCVRACVSLC
eukprot:jgi/Bigna1/82536/fgenesh1_pg.93_\